MSLAGGKNFNPLFAMIFCRDFLQDPPTNIRVFPISGMIFIMKIHCSPLPKKKGRKNERKKNIRFPLIFNKSLFIFLKHTHLFAWSWCLSVDFFRKSFFLIVWFKLKHWILILEVNWTKNLWAYLIPKFSRIIWKGFGFGRAEAKVLKMDFGFLPKEDKFWPSYSAKFRLSLRIWPN